MELLNWWKRWKKGDAVCKVANVDSLNRVYNVLESIEAIGLNGIDAQINKPIDADGRGWTITIDGNPVSQKVPKNGPGDSQSTAVIVLTGYGPTANQSSWQYGDTNSQGKLLRPVVHPYRLWWSASDHQLLYFERELYYTENGLLWRVTAESAPQAVFTTVPENF